MAVVWALAVTIVGCVEAAVREASGPLTFASALIAVARLVRLLLNPVSNPAWVDKSVCWFCNAVNERFCGARIAFTTDCTLMPFPFSRLEALKLTPIVFLLFLILTLRLWPKLKLFPWKRCISRSGSRRRRSGLQLFLGSLTLNRSRTGMHRA